MRIRSREKLFGALVENRLRSGTVAFFVRRMAASGPLQLPQSASQRFDFMFIGQFLPFGQFHEFQHFFQLLHRVFERLDDLHHLMDGLADGGGMRCLHGCHFFRQRGNALHEGRGFGRGGRFRPGSGSGWRP